MLQLWRHFEFTASVFSKQSVSLETKGSDCQLGPLRFQAVYCKFTASSILQVKLEKKLAVNLQ